MENVHSAIAWYQKKIGSYDKQLWEQSVEKKLQKGLPNVHHAPRKTVRLKTEYIDVDLIRGSTFTKTKPQVPWIYITRKAFVRVLFFPFYYKWWVHQTSWSVFLALFFLYTLQVITSIVYFRNVDGSIIEDELALTEVVVPISLMFLLGLIHSQAVLAHISLKPPRRDGRLRKPKKRQRQNNLLSGEQQADATHRERSPSRERRSRVSPPRTIPVINTLWNLPRVEVSTADQSTAPSSSDMLQAKSVRSARKVRIMEQAQSYEPSTSRSSDIFQDLEDNGLGYGSVDDSASPDSGSKAAAVAAAVGETAATCEPLVCCETGKVGGEEGGFSQGACCNNSGVDTGNRCIGSGVKGSQGEGCAVAEANRGSGGNDEGCDLPTPGCSEISPSVKDTSDSDSIVGKFEFVNLDSKDMQHMSDVLETMEHCSTPDLGSQKETVVAKEPLSLSSALEQLADSQASEVEEKGQGQSSASEPTDSLSFHSRRMRGCSLQGSSCEIYDSSYTREGSNECMLQDSCSDRSALRDGSSNSDLEGMPRLLTRGCRGDRGSVSEDMLDQKEEDNLSDTGHVSNSSNYNPSDSGPESDAEGDNLDDSLQLTISKHSGSDNPSTEVSSAPSSLALASSPSPSSALPSLTSSPRKTAQQQQQQEGESSASEPGSPDARLSPVGGGVRRRRRPSSNQSTSEQGDVTRQRPLPPKLLGLRAQSRNTQTSGISSSENEAGRPSPESGSKGTMSSEEWEDRMQSDMTTSSSYSTSNSESELSENENIEDEEEDPLAHEIVPGGVFHGINFLQPSSTSNAANTHPVQPDKVSCVIWEGNECKKVDLTALDIGWAIIDKVDNLPESSDYIFIGLFLSLCLGCVPLVYRLYFVKDMPNFMSYPFLDWLWARFMDNSWRQNLLIMNGIIQRLTLSCIFFFLLTVTDRTFKQRLLYAKHFSYLTSSRRARKFDMPHFRLNKVRNIKIWLSLRSYLKRRGPQRSVDVIVSASFYSSISLICLMCIQMLKDTETYLDYLCNWELIVWCIALGIYIMRFMTLGLKINKKYRNLSVLITEQINLYLQMEQKPHKKEELTLANNVLRLAEDLLKELESPFKISGFSANPLIYNITKVVVLSAFSAVMTELLGFKLKLYKIKLKA